MIEIRQVAVIADSVQQNIFQERSDILGSVGCRFSVEWLDFFTAVQKGYIHYGTKMTVAMFYQIFFPDFQEEGFSRQSFIVLELTM